MNYPHQIQSLIDEFSKFPGIGLKTAERFVFYLFKKNSQDLERFSQLIKNLEQVKICSICGFFSEKEICSICADSRRDHLIICLVAEPQDLMAIEKTGEYRGVYHLLGGLIKVSQGIGPEQLRIKELIQRVQKSKGKIREVILAFNPDLEGETTSLYLVNLLKPYRLKITRLGRGLPMGSDLEYVDEITLSDALKNRKTL